MKITELRLENFKCFTDIKAKVNKLTLITGANSSGKSSFIYGLLSPLQSGDFPLNFSTNGKFVNMGDFEDISYLHNKNSEIKIGFTISAKKELNIDTFWVYDKIRKLPRLKKIEANSDYFNLLIISDDENSYSLSFTYDETKDSNSSLESFELQKKINLVIHETLSKNDKSQKSVDSYLKKIEAKFKRNNKKITLKSQSLELLTKEIDEKGSYALSSAFSQLRMIFNQIDENTNYISSFRFHPQKIRNEITKDNLRIGKYGDNYEDQILYWETKKNKKFDELVTKLKTLGILQDIKTSRVSGGNYELKVKTHKTGVFSSLTDVGFGISQFLPILVSDIQLGKNSTLFISQPEIHLHPQIQSEFGNYLLSEITGTNKSYIIETHSEYLLNKIRLLIVQKKLKPEDVSIYYFQKNGNKTEKFELEFTIDGQIKNAPADFFDTYMTDVIDIALNA